MWRLRKSKHLIPTYRNGITKTRPVPLLLMYYSTTTTTTQIQGLNRNDEETVRKISTILSDKNWKVLIDSSDIPKKLNPDVIRTVLRQNQLGGGGGGDPNLLRSFFLWSETKIGKAHLDLDLLSTLAVILCNAKLQRYANSILERMIVSRKSPLKILGSIVACYRECQGSNPVVFDLLVNLYRKKLMLPEAVTVFVSPKDVEFTPPRMSYCNSLLRDLLRANRLVLFWKVIDTMSSEFKILPDVSTYTNMIGAHFRVGNVCEAKNVFSEMGEKGCIPSVATYNVVIKGLCKEGSVDEAIKMKDSMAEKGLVPDVYTFANLINGFCREKRLIEAKSMLLEMKNMGLKPDVITYNALIYGSIKLDLEEAFKIWDEIVASGVDIDIFLYNTFIYGVCKARQMDKAREILNEMIARGLKPDFKTYTFLIEGHCREHDYVSAFRVLEELKKSDMTPTSRTYRKVIKGLNRNGNIKQINAISEEMVTKGLKTNTVGCTTLITANLRQGRLDESGRILDWMKERHLTRCDVL